MPDKLAVFDGPIISEKAGRFDAGHSFGPDICSQQDTIWIRDYRDEVGQSVRQTHAFDSRAGDRTDRRHVASGARTNEDAAEIVSPRLAVAELNQSGFYLHGTVGQERSPCGIRVGVA